MTHRFMEWWNLWRREIGIGALATLGLSLVVGVSWYLFQTIPADLTEGTVRNRDFTPAHYEDEMRTRQVYDGQDCHTTTNSNGSTSQSCTSRYRTETYWVEVYYPDDWD